MQTGEDGQLDQWICVVRARRGSHRDKLSYPVREHVAESQKKG
jgi:hypothetical protein